MKTRNQDVLMEYKRVRNKVQQETRKMIKQEQYDMSKQYKHNPKKIGITSTANSNLNNRQQT